MAFKFPFTNYHELNLTWILDQLKSLFEKSEENVTVIENYDGRLTSVETELPLVADTAQDAAQTAAAAASLAQTAKATADTAQENAIQAQSAAGTARQEAQDAQTAADAATQAAQQAQAATMNFDGRITQAENNALSALNKIGNLGDLRTSAKNNLVAAINEVDQSGGGGSGGAVNDVQIDGQSIVSNGIASIPLASSARYGVTRPLQNGGVSIDAQGRISTARASLASIKTAIANYPVIVPSNQYAAVFYGLATAAGDSTQASSSNEVGTYTEQAKSSIISMLGVTNLLNAKQNAPTAAGMAGQVLGLDSSLNPVWINQSGGGGGEMWYEAELSAADYDSALKMILFDAGAANKIKDAIIIGQIVNDGTQTGNEIVSFGIGNTVNRPQYSIIGNTESFSASVRRLAFALQISVRNMQGIQSTQIFRCAYPLSFFYGTSNISNSALNVDVTPTIEGTKRATCMYSNFNDSRFLKIELPTWIPSWAYIKIYYTLM